MRRSFKRDKILIISFPVFQPIGNTVMDTRVLKEPRGFMRCIEWLFAIIAFSLCCDFATYVEYTVDCKGAGSTHYKHSLSYPFK